MIDGLLCIGLTTLDILARPVDDLPRIDTTALLDKIVLVPAGTAAGTAMVAARLGVRTALASSLGSDPAGRLVRAELQAAGIDTELVETSADLPTSVTILPINSAGHRPNLHAPGAGRHVADTQRLREAAKNAKFLHFAAIGGSGLRAQDAAAMLATAKRGGSTVTCDLISPRRSAVDELKQILPQVDYFMPNAAEAKLLSGLDELREAGKFFLDLGAGACVFTDGAQGSVLIDQSGEVRFAAHAISPVDTTSCGDSYCAGFIAALNRGWTVREACTFAGAVSALVALGVGTLGALTSFDAAEELMRSAMA